MTDTAVVGRLLRAYHLRGVPPGAIRRLSGSPAGLAVSYLVAPGPGPALLVRACRADAPVPAQFRGPFSATALDWLVGRAATLEFLAAAGYPAPRLVPTHTGDPVGLDGAWLTLATSYVTGRPLRPTLAELRLLGEALGRLHALPVPEPRPSTSSTVSIASAVTSGSQAPAAMPAPGHAAWDPVAAIPATLDRLDRVAALVPPEWLALHGLFRETVLAVRRRLAELPRGVVHGDAWPGNAVQAVPGQLALIDWETGGVGLPVLDLGYCLIESLLDVPAGAAPADGAEDVLPPDMDPPGAPGPARWLVEPEESRITAVASGYAAWRVLSPAEHDLLLPAIRFAVAYLGAIHFEQALLDGVRGPSMDARLARLRNRLDVSAAVARLASPPLAGGPQPVR